MVEGDISLETYNIIINNVFVLTIYFLNFLYFLPIKTSVELKFYIFIKSI